MPTSQIAKTLNCSIRSIQRILEDINAEAKAEMFAVCNNQIAKDWKLTLELKRRYVCLANNIMDNSKDDRVKLQAITTADSINDSASDLLSHGPLLYDQIHKVIEYQEHNQQSYNELQNRQQNIQRFKESLYSK